MNLVNRRTCIGRRGFLQRSFRRFAAAAGLLLTIAACLHQPVDAHTSARVSARGPALDADRVGFFGAEYHRWTVTDVEFAFHKTDFGQVFYKFQHFTPPQHEHGGTTGTENATASKRTPPRYVFFFFHGTPRSSDEFTELIKELTTTWRSTKLLKNEPWSWISMDLLGQGRSEDFRSDRYKNSILSRKKEYVGVEEYGRIAREILSTVFDKMTAAEGDEDMSTTTAAKPGGYNVADEFDPVRLLAGLDAFAGTSTRATWSSSSRNHGFTFSPPDTGTREYNYTKSAGGSVKCDLQSEDEPEVLDCKDGFTSTSASDAGHPPSRRRGDTIRQHELRVIPVGSLAGCAIAISFAYELLIHAPKGSAECAGRSSTTRGPTAQLMSSLLYLGPSSTTSAARPRYDHGAASSASSTCSPSASSSRSCATASTPRARGEATFSEMNSQPSVCLFTTILHAPIYHMTESLRAQVLDYAQSVRHWEPGRDGSHLLHFWENPSFLPSSFLAGVDEKGDFSRGSRLRTTSIGTPGRGPAAAKSDDAGGRTGTSAGTSGHVDAADNSDVNLLHRVVVDMLRSGKTQWQAILAFLEYQRDPLGFAYQLTAIAKLGQADPNVLLLFGEDMFRLPPRLLPKAPPTLTDTEGSGLRDERHKHSGVVVPSRAETYWTEKFLLRESTLFLLCSVLKVPGTSLPPLDSELLQTAGDIGLTAGRETLASQKSSLNAHDFPQVHRTQQSNVASRVLNVIGNAGEALLSEEPLRVALAMLGHVENRLERLERGKSPIVGRMF
ncbi:unnamed protein product [Amoebophrya sp. A120]|nr:unnamed protein product [Amoebophrya sp. A120]|eukprot:GSA120T00003937001.1